MLPAPPAPVSVASGANGRYSALRAIGMTMGAQGRTAEGPIDSRQPAFARVLLVDDNEADILLTRRLLFDRRGLRCQFEFARSSAEAFQRMISAYDAGRPCDLVLLDINMPGQDGFAFLRQMRAERGLRATPVIMCTGSAHPKDLSEARTLGAIGYITKPPTMDKLRAILERLPLLDLRDEGEVHSLLHIA